MSGLSQTANATVSWTGADGAISDGDDYIYVEGTVNVSGEQESILTIKTAKLQVLGTSSTFTCKVTSGEYPDSETATNTMTLTTLTFGRFSFSLTKIILNFSNL